MPEGDLVRWEIEFEDRSRRGLEDRLLLAAPSIAQSVSRRALRQRAGSRFRQAALTGAVQRGFAANNRDDYDAMLAAFHPEVELLSPGRGELGIGFDAVYRGPEGVRRFIEQWKSGFTHFRYEPREIADAGGDRFAVRVGMIGTLRGSNAELRDEYGVVITVANGLVLRQDNYFAWEDALAVLEGRDGGLTGRAQGEVP